MVTRASWRATGIAYAASADSGDAPLFEYTSHSVSPANATYAVDGHVLRISGEYDVSYASPADESNPRHVAMAILWDIAQRIRNAD